MFDKLKEYKENQERKRYFRSNNDLYLDTNQWIKTIIGGLAVALLSGAIIYYVTELLNIVSSVFYIVLGYAVASTVKSISNVESRQMGVLAVILTIIGSLFSIMLVYIIAFQAMGITIAAFPYLLKSTVFSLFNDLFLLICIVVACFVAYQQAS
jgi:hypothetical protein